MRCLKLWHMITIRIDKPGTLAELRACYANKLNTVSMGARRKANNAKKKFMALVQAQAMAQGKPIDAKADAIMVLCLCLPRIDWDAPVKAICDALQSVALGSRDDAQIKFAWVFLTRPSKRKKRKPYIEATFYNSRTERGAALAQCEKLLNHCVSLSGHDCL